MCTSYPLSKHFLLCFTEGDWFCSNKCKAGQGKLTKSSRTTRDHDHVHEYSSALVWRGLFHRARKDAERENDGVDMNTHWKIDSLQFWENNHYKYLILSHRLAAGEGLYVHSYVIVNVNFDSKV